MKLLARMRSLFRRVPTSSEGLAEFSLILEGDSDPARIERGLETVLRRSLRRTVLVVSTGRFNTHEGESSEDHAWSLDRRTIEAHLDRLRSESKFTELFGEEARTAGRRIAALVPVCSSTGSRLATVVIGRKPLFPLADSECSLIVAAVGMATLLLEQVRVRDMLRVAEAQAETVKRLVESRRRVMFGQN